jgi:ArsR family transcriptional regulator, arsenate/arsenite/antimonite-responsive transcriptional repressor
MKSLTVVKALSALAQSSRLDIFKALVVVGSDGLTPSALAEQLNVAPSALSFHLKELANAELITQERDGRNLVYRPNLDFMNDLLGYLTDNCCQGQPCAVAVVSHKKPK